MMEAGKRISNRYKQLHGEKSPRQRRKVIHADGKVFHFKVRVYPPEFTPYMDSLIESYFTVIARRKPWQNNKKAIPPPAATQPAKQPEPTTTPGKRVRQRIKVTHQQVNK